MTYSEIASELDTSEVQVWRDLKRARDVQAQLLAEQIQSTQLEAKIRRQAIQHAAMQDRARAVPEDAHGRASLLRVVGDQQTAIEELDGLRSRKGEEASRSGNVFVFMNGSGNAKSRGIEDLSDEELLALEERLGQDGR